MTLNDFEAQLRERTKALLLGNIFQEDAPARRIAAQVIRSGFHSLSWQERFLFLGRVAPLARDMATGSEWRTA